MKRPFEIGDRVRRVWLETVRFGVVTEVYRGAPSANNNGIEMVAVQWDDTGLVERGYWREQNEMMHTYLALAVSATPTAPTTAGSPGERR